MFNDDDSREPFVIRDELREDADEKSTKMNEQKKK